MEEYNYDYNSSTIDFDSSVPAIQPMEIVSLVCYGLVFLLGVPGNALVVFVMGWHMPRTVNSMWFLNLSLADLLCCLSLPLLMVPLAHDNHWHFGPVACQLITGLFYLVMYCSVLLLVLISVDRWLMVNRPVWCQNHRQPRQATWACVGVWSLAALCTVPQVVYTQEGAAGTKKRECVGQHTVVSEWVVTSFRFLLGFILPFLIIAVSHWVVYMRATSGNVSVARSMRTLRVSVAVAISFFLCWLPLYLLDFVTLQVPRTSPHRPSVHRAHKLALCLAYFNSCLNPLLYVCLGRAFKEGMSRSLRNVFHFISEDPVARMSSSTAKDSSTNV